MDYYNSQYNRSKTVIPQGLSVARRGDVLTPENSECFLSGHASATWALL
jgi:hypothetical protein